MASKVVTFRSGPLTLEGVLEVPDSATPQPAVVVCHPHPRMGGSMANNVVMAVCFGLRQAGIGSFRFNFRGVGGSQGSYSNGVGEQADITAAISFLSGQDGVDPDRLGLAGYSFGSRMALSVVQSEERVKALALISPPAEPELMEKSLRVFKGSKFVLMGSMDNFITLEIIPDFLRYLLKPEEYRIVEGADHFWLGYEPEISRAVADFFTTALLRSRVKEGP